MDYTKFFIRSIGWACATSAVMSSVIYFGIPFFVLMGLALILIVLGAEHE